MASNDSAGRLITLPQLREVLLTVVVVFAFTSLLLIIAGAPPLEAYYHLFLGSLSSWIKFTHVVKVWIPLTLCACGLLFTFRIGLWNIGVEGQVMIGAVFSTWALRAGVALSINLTGNVYVNQSAAFSDFHGTGANPAANASLTDSAFVASRFRVVQHRAHV